MLARDALREQIGTAVAFIDGPNPRAGWPAAAGVDDGADLIGRTGKYGFDGAVAAVTHPAINAVHGGRVLDEGAEAHRLHPPAHAHATNDLAHPISPVATPRVPRNPGIHRAIPAI